MKKAFTLIELLVALSIMALIMGLSLTAFDSTKKSARDGRRKADIESIRSALEIYRSDNSVYPANLNLLTPSYVTTIPTDPVATQSYVYSCTPPCYSYTLCATLEQVSGACGYVTRNP
ncbi:MAG: type II secretion system protein [Patescibacteria group bacterium]